MRRTSTGSMPTCTGHRGNTWTARTGRAPLYYGGDWVTNPRPPLSLCLPVHSKPYDHDECFPLLRGSLPRATYSKRSPARSMSSATDPFRLLTELGGECSGAISVAPQRAGARRGPPAATLVDEEELGTLLRIFPSACSSPRSTRSRTGAAFASRLQRPGRGRRPCRRRRDRAQSREPPDHGRYSRRRSLASPNRWSTRPSAWALRRMSISTSPRQAPVCRFTGVPAGASLRPRQGGSPTAASIGELLQALGLVPAVNYEKRRCTVVAPPI